MAAQNYVKSFEKAVAVKMFCITKEESGSKFRAELVYYIQLVLESLLLFSH